MDLIADILLVAGALGATVYCFVLSRRLSRFTDLQGGMGGAVASLSAQVDEMTRALDRSRRAAEGQSGSLERSTRRAEDVARRLDLLVAAMHDLPAEASGPGRGQARRAAPQPEARLDAQGPEPVAARPQPAAPAPERAAQPVAARQPEPARVPATEPAAAPAFEPLMAARAPAAASAPPPEEAGEGRAAGAASWDDWDPFEVSEPSGEAPLAAQTSAPERAIGSREPGRAGADPRAATEPAPKPTLKAGPKPSSTPIFTAARPAIRSAAGALPSPTPGPVRASPPVTVPGARSWAVGE